MSEMTEDFQEFLRLLGNVKRRNLVCRVNEDMITVWYKNSNTRVFIHDLDEFVIDLMEFMGIDYENKGLLEPDKEIHF